MSGKADRHVPVLVVGGSLVGLTTSALLADHGVQHLLVEGHHGTAIHPRTALFDQRTMEVFRSAGLQDAGEEAAAEEFVRNGAIMAVESLGGKELQYFFHSYNEGLISERNLSVVYVIHPTLLGFLRFSITGDAAHVMPPTGGFDGNTGVADAHNLAWKLALVINGFAGSGLLDSYDEERRANSALMVEQAYTRYALRVDPSLPRDDLQPPLDDAAIELGASYRSGAVLDGGSLDEPLDDARVKSWPPGTRAPHLWIDDRTTVGVAGHGFALIVTDDEDDWLKAAEEAQRLVGVRVSVQLLNVGGASWQGTVLVRPDGVVARRTENTAATAGLYAALTGVLDRVSAA